MKKFILSAILLVFCASLYAQKIQFSDPTNVWSLLDSTVGCCIPRPVGYNTAYYDSTGTVSFNGHTYQSLITPVASVLVREDSDKVFVVGTSDSTERVLYNFNLHLNDTTRLVYPQDIYTTWVVQIDSTEIAGLWYKVWSFEGIDSVLYYPDSASLITYNVIEGIGCTNGVYYPASPINRVSFYELLLCFQNDLNLTTGLSNPVACLSNNSIGAYFDNDSSCREFHATHHDTLHAAPSSIQPLAQAGRYTLVAPNPTNETSKIIFPSLISSGNLVVTNAMGQVVISIPFRDKDELLIGDKIKLPGIYFYKVMDNESGKVFSGKFTH